jgi:hypothetical protein
MAARQQCYRLSHRENRLDVGEDKYSTNCSTIGITSSLQFPRASCFRDMAVLFKVIVDPVALPDEVQQVPEGLP